MTNPVRSHEYSFSLYSGPTVDLLIAELQRAAAILGGDSKVRLTSTESQCDGYTLLRAVIQGPT